MSVTGCLERTGASSFRLHDDDEVSSQRTVHPVEKKGSICVCVCGHQTIDTCSYDRWSDQKRSCTRGCNVPVTRGIDCGQPVF